MGVESKNANQIVFLDFHFRGYKVGRVILELHTKSAPRTCENFRALCTGEYGVGKAGKPLHFKGSFIHKVIPNVMIQGGDITNHDGSGGDTIYGRLYTDEDIPNVMMQGGDIPKYDGSKGDTIYGRTYTDEINSDTLMFREAGVLGLANSVDHPKEHTSQFFITVEACPHLEEGNRAFGKVLKGLDIIRELSCMEHVKSVPVDKIEIGDCGEIKPGEDWGYIEKDGTSDVYPPFPADWELPGTDDDKVKAVKGTQAAEDIKESGNSFFFKKDYPLASRKYEKALRYLDWAKKLNDNTEMDKDQYNTCLLNLAASKLKLEEFSKARTLCSTVISRKPGDKKLAAKAFFRRGKANSGLGEYEVAIKDLKSALKLDKDKCILTEIYKVEKASKDYVEKEKRTYAAMLK